MSEKKKMKLWKKFIIGIFLIAVIGAVFGEPPANKPTANVNVNTPAVVLPSSNTEMIGIVGKYKTAYQSSTNELLKSNIKQTRNTDLINFLSKSSGVVEFVGTVATLSTTTEGNAHIQIILSGSDNIYVSTANNEFSDIGYSTLIPNGSALYNKIAGIGEGATVKFSAGFLFDGDTGLVAEQSLTEDGCMTEPEFLVRILTVEFL